MKAIFIALFAFSLCVSVFTGCQTAPAKTNKQIEAEKKAFIDAKAEQADAEKLLQHNSVSDDQIVDVEGIVFKSSDLTTPYTGLVIWKHENGRRKLESPCKAGIWNGPSKWWYKNGKLEGEGSYKNGKWEGKYREWHENGNLMVQVTFKDSKEVGKEIWWHENGKVRSVTSYKAGKKEGKAVGFFESGKKSWEASWADNFPNGEYWEWYENGDKKSVLRYVKSVRHGKEEHWHKSEGKSQNKQQKSREVEWVNDKEIYRRQWDQNGKVVFDGPVIGGPPPSETGAPRLVFTRQPELKEEGNFYLITGTVQNNSATDTYFQVGVKFLLQDAQGNPLGMVQDYVASLDPGKTWNFRVLVIDPDATQYVLQGNIGGTR